MITFTQEEQAEIKRCMEQQPAAESELEAVDNVRAEVYKLTMQADENEYGRLASRWIKLNDLVSKLRKNYGSSKQAFAA